MENKKNYMLTCIPFNGDTVEFTGLSKYEAKKKREILLSSSKYSSVTLGRKSSAHVT